MSLIIKNSSGSEIKFDNIVSINVEMRQNIIDVTLPGEDKPDIMTIGGIDWYIDLEVIEVADENNTVSDIFSNIWKVMGTGKIAEKFLVTIDEWGVTQEAVIESVKIRQDGGEPNKLNIGIRMIWGNVLG